MFFITTRRAKLQAGVMDERKSAEAKECKTQKLFHRRFTPRYWKGKPVTLAVGLRVSESGGVSSVIVTSGGLGHIRISTAAIQLLQEVNTSTQRD